MNPRSTDFEADALTTTPSPLLHDKAIRNVTTGVCGLNLDWKLLSVDLGKIKNFDFSKEINGKIFITTKQRRIESAIKNQF